MSDATIQPAVVAAVVPNSIAAELGFTAGDRLVAVNGEHPRDLIDYQFLCSEEELRLEVLDERGKTHWLEIEKEMDEDLGLEFTTALFDGLIQCTNHCPFCFIDQQPPGKRASLYDKDDDYRLSFLYGSYLTLTNLGAKEWERIARMRLSPLFVSVHATEPEVRTRLLKNPRAGQIKDQLQWFQDQRLQIHAQVVVCPGINDGQHLEQTLRDLAQWHQSEVPAVASVAVVPVGLTKFRPAVDELTPVTPAQAATVITQVQTLQAQFQTQLGSTFAWLADEWFLIAGHPIPAAAHYGDYPQLGNGVGSIRWFLKEFQQAARRLPQHVTPPRRWIWVVGNAVEKAFQPIVERLNRVQGLEVELLPIASHYWGQAISVTGLITGEDIVRGFQAHSLDINKFNHQGLLLPSLMLKPGDDRFLDDMSLAELQQQIPVPIVVVAGGAKELIQKCLQPVPSQQSPIADK
jgi:putative radical SAM enzyme (TIGR03279 family)